MVQVLCWNTELVKPQLEPVHQRRPNSGEDCREKNTHTALLANSDLTTQLVD